ncbi:MAG: 3-hydroxylacyl-ACP dehydratase [Kangiellaceae bacterium]|nr:3-hydroxylacyl-ACP dehydratase [Kangiellaceae bacterium]
MTYSVEELLPHSAPMILVDRLVDYGEEHVVAEIDLDDQHPFFQDGAIPGWVGIELMAQSVGLFAGIEQRKNNEDITVGFLVGTRRYEAHVPVLPVNVTLRAECYRIMQEDELSVFQCSLMLGDKVLAEAKLNTFKPLDPQQYFEGVKHG